MKKVEQCGASGRRLLLAQKGKIFCTVFKADPMLFRPFWQVRLQLSRKCGLIKNALSQAKVSPTRRKVMGSVNNWQMLVDGILEEDRLLRERLTQCPLEVRDLQGSHGALSFKETLGHIAFWDNFTVEFFSNKLDNTSLNPCPLVNFEERSKTALENISKLPFGEVLARYLEATGALTSFLGKHWEELSPREKHDFWVPLKHRRHHRISLFEALDQLFPAKEMLAEA